MSDGARNAARGGGRLWWTLAALLIALAILVAFLAWFLSRGRGREPLMLGQETRPATETAGSRGAVLFFVDPRNGGAVSEDRQLPSRDRRDEDVRAVLDALVAGPQGGGRAASGLPPGVRLLDVFVDPDAEELVLDWSRELVTGQPGGSAAEEAAVASILRTVAWNFPELETCTLLVAGAPVATLAGHVDVRGPFPLRRWR